MNLIIGYLLVISIVLFIFKRKWFYSFWRWIFRLCLSLFRFLFTKGLKAIGWFLIRFLYWLVWLIWEFILFCGRAIGALFKLLSAR